MPVYVRLRDLTTGHRWDSCLEAAAAYLATGGVEIVTRYPPYEASRPLRRSKHFRGLDGRPARPRRITSTTEEKKR